MRENLTQSTEDYLKAIYDLTLNGERATTNQIAEQLGVKPASVTGMLKRLAASDPPLLEYRKHQGAGLTEEGRRAALKSSVITVFSSCFYTRPWVIPGMKYTSKPTA